MEIILNTLFVHFPWVIFVNKTFIFDYDDTLAPNEYCYSFAELKLTEWIMQKFGPRTPKPYEIGNLEVSIDKAAVSTMGFCKERFPTSCRETYRRICEIKGIIPSEDDLRIAYTIGTLAFDAELWRKHGLMEGAAETLDFLVEQNDELILFSKGDKEVQEGKFRATGIMKWFGNKIHVVPTKKSKDILDICGNREKELVYCVGNSVRSDVQPALEAGVNMIYVPLETWEWEMEHKGVPEHQRLKTIKSIIELKEKYEVLTS